jgi:Domain of unknown function (DUF4405)
MKIRKITSITASLAFMLMVLTSIILYIVPQGRVAYWADWRLWGLSKTEWGNIHINLGLLFLIALFLHIYYNWKPLMSYLKNKSKELKVFTPEFNVSLVITVAFIVGTYTLVPPFKWVMTLNDHFKESGAEKYGEPPYGHAELSSLKTFTRKMNLDLNKSVALLDQAGYPVEGQDETLAAIGRRHHIPPQRVYETIESAKNDSPAVAGNGNALPDTPPVGSGNLTLADFCAQFNLNMKELVRELKQRNISASEQSTLKEIAADNSTSPIDIYQAIREIIAG